jgi:hypothetical protein
MSQRYWKTRVIVIFSLAVLSLPSLVMAQANMRREGPLTLNQTSDDTKGFYAATIDPSNGFAYFAAKYVYKVNITTPLPTQVGAGVSLGRLAYSGVMDSAAGCAYFGVGNAIYQILANGTNAPSLGGVMIPPINSSAFLTQLLIDTSDPANHNLYVMTEISGTSSTLYKIALNNYPNASAVIGSATTTAQQPGLGYGVIDLTNGCAYYGTFIPLAQPPYLAKFALGSGTNGPTNLGGVFLDTATNRSIGGIVLDIAHGYGYCDSDGNDLLFGHARVYKWALNGTAAPTLVSYVDMRTNEGYCHVAVIKPQNGLLYFSSDLSYPAYVYRFRLPAGTNAPVETGNIPLLASVDTNVPAWGYNPTNSTNWGEVFARSIVYDPIRDFAYIGRDCADGQTQPYTDQIVKVALDRDEALFSLTEAATNTSNTLPYNESFGEYGAGASLIGTNGWFGEDLQMAIIATNNYTNAYSGVLPIPGPQQLVLQVDGAVTNQFSAPGADNVLLDTVVQCKIWTDPLLPVLSNAATAFCVTTNGHLAIWNCTNPPAVGNGWTELTDTSIASNQFFRVTIEAAYDRDTNNEFYFRFWLNGAPSIHPQTWYASADTNQNYLGGIMAQGRFALNDLVLKTPVITVTDTRNPDGSINLSCQGIPGLPHRVWTTTNLAQSFSWQPLSTNLSGADGSWQLVDASATNFPFRFYRASLP